jgi:hypothetical protein
MYHIGVLLKLEQQQHGALILVQVHQIIQALKQQVCMSELLGNFRRKKSLKFLILLANTTI